MALILILPTLKISESLALCTGQSVCALGPKIISAPVFLAKSMWPETKSRLYQLLDFFFVFHCQKFNKSCFTKRRRERMGTSYDTQRQYLVVYTYLPYSCVQRSNLYDSNAKNPSVYERTFVLIKILYINNYIHSFTCIISIFTTFSVASSTSTESIKNF